ncbi:MAG: class II aldolase/adducin family protein [Burkholderiaceae bacterium]
MADSLVRWRPCRTTSRYRWLPPLDRWSPGSVSGAAARIGQIDRFAGAPPVVTCWRERRSGCSTRSEPRQALLRLVLQQGQGKERPTAVGSGTTERSSPGGTHVGRPFRSLRPIGPFKSPPRRCTRRRIELAAIHRLAVERLTSKGIDNHFTVTVPGTNDHYLILPFGLHWSKRARDMIVFDESGRTLDGEGDVGLSRQCIHAPIHRITGARVVLHTHQHWAVALNMLQNNRLLPLSQTAAYFPRAWPTTIPTRGHRGHLVRGRAPSRPGRRQAGVVHEEPRRAGQVAIRLQAYRRLYKLGAPVGRIDGDGRGAAVGVLSDEIVARVQALPPDDRHPRAERERLLCRR